MPWDPLDGEVGVDDVEKRLYVTDMWIFPEACFAERSNVCTDENSVFNAVGSVLYPC